MNRREFFKFLTATPAAFLVAKYGMPGGGVAPNAAKDGFCEQLSFASKLFGRPMEDVLVFPQEWLDEFTDFAADASDLPRQLLRFPKPEGDVTS